MLNRSAKVASGVRPQSRLPHQKVALDHGLRTAAMRSTSSSGFLEVGMESEAFRTYTPSVCFISCAPSVLHTVGPSADLSRWQWASPTVKGESPSSRNNHATCVVGSTLFVHGGHDGARWLPDLWCLDTEALQWSQPATSGVQPSARACHTCTLMESRRGGRKIYVFGGYNGSHCFNDLEVLDVDALSWLRPHTSGTQPTPRNAHTMTAVGTALILYGGHSGSKHLRDVHVLQTSTMTWSSPELSGSVPPGLRGHTATLIGKSTLFIFGGYDGRGRSNDLFLLNADSWSWEHPQPSQQAPSGRQRHTATLIGKKRLLILGGFDGYRWLSDMHLLDVGALEESAITHASVLSLVTDLGGLVNNPDAFPDIQFDVQGTTIYAHKSILCARSAHYAAMFRSGMAESAATVVTMHDCSAAAFQAQLEFLYTGSVPHFTGEIAVEVMTLADRLGLFDLHALCESALMQHIDSSSVVALLLTAHRHGAKELKQHCLSFIMGLDSDVEGIIEQLSVEPALLMEMTKAMWAKHKDTT